MLSFRSYPIRKKLVLISMVSTATALVMASIALIIYDIIQTEQTIKKELSILTTVIGDRSSAALVFDDKEYARDNLTALNAQNSIVSACLYTNDGSVFATYSREHTNESVCQAIKLDNYNHNEDEDNIQFNNSRIHHSDIFLSQPIFLDGELIGAISILFDTSNIQIRIYRYISIVAIIFLIAVGAAFILSARLQRVISAPISQLGKTAKHISAHNDYSIRAIKHNDDELGLLVDIFNDMLKTIQEQNMTVVATKERYRVMYDDNPAMLFTINIDGKVLSINQFGAEQLGYNVIELVGHSLLSITHEEDKEVVLTNIEACFNRPKDVHNWKSRLLHKNESVLWVKDKARVITGNDGKPSILIMCENITEERILSEQLIYNASHDELTGLINRREFEVRLDHFFATARSDRCEHALLYMDLDQFKIVNDTCGHVAGDDLLRQICDIMKGKIRESDTLARLGGDEFGVLLEHCALDKAQTLADKILKAIQNFQFAWEDRIFRVGVSIGMVAITKDSLDPTEILKLADTACYAAKDGGRNRIHVYQDKDVELVQRQGEMQWVSKLEDALHHNKFILYAQPIVPVIPTSDDYVHYEILLRLNDEAGRSVPPGTFLPAAERYNLSPRLDRWVIENTFSWLINHPDQLERLSLCSINLSGNSLADESFLDFVVSTLSRLHIPPEKICFEITETAAIANFSHASVFLNTLSKLGSRFALDDFGSGLSSFAYLKNLPVDFLKIDGVFVKEIDTNQIDLAMVKSINEIGHVMGKYTIAEFVENDSILKKLKEIGVDYAQGFNIGSPQPLEERVILETVAI
jgi:diguanylate cyclase (GGDEF)-like protein/PAS domain S-box-containing protein